MKSLPRQKGPDPVVLAPEVYNRMCDMIEAAFNLMVAPPLQRRDHANGRSLSLAQIANAIHMQITVAPDTNKVATCKWVDKGGGLSTTTVSVLTFNSHSVGDNIWAFFADNTAVNDGAGLPVTWIENSGGGGGGTLEYVTLAVHSGTSGNTGNKTTAAAFTYDFTTAASVSKSNVAPAMQRSTKGKMAAATVGIYDNKADVLVLCDEVPVNNCGTPCSS